MKQKSIFAQRLSQARKAKGWSQWSFSEEIGWSIQSVIAWENDYRLPKIDALADIVKTLGVSADWLLGVER